MCEACGTEPDISGYYPGQMPYDRLYRQNPLSWQDLYQAQAFESKEEKFLDQNVKSAEFNPDAGEVDFESNRRLSRRQQNEISQDLFNQFTDQGQDSSSERKTKKKAKRRSNNSPETVFSSGLIRVNKNDPFDQGGIDPGSIVPGLRGQMPVFMMQGQQLL